MRYLLRRLGFYVAALWAAATINFFIPRLMPGDPAAAFIAKIQQRGASVLSPNMINAVRLQFGESDEPLWIQYFKYLNNLLHGDMGISISQFPSRVSQVLITDLPWTLALVGLSVIISFVLGTLLGVVVSWRRGGWLDTVLTPLLTFFSAIPYFWLALSLVYILALSLNWLPLGGGYDTLNPDLQVGWNSDFVLSVLQHAFLPAFTIVIASLAGWMLGMRNASITTLSEDYVLMARAKGLPERRVMLAYAARNAILPSITSFGLQLGFVVAGSLVTEIIFNYPGIGFTLYTAIISLDYSMIEGVFLIIALAILAANFLAEIAYVLLDPRVRHERGN
ncbi:MAG TPA: ABC transporter permease [Ktedonosporobacter sp.]|nr:ABC transporter permease [Ktedonosporobacter sp.]